MQALNTSRQGLENRVGTIRFIGNVSLAQQKLINRVLNLANENDHRSNIISINNGYCHELLGLAVGNSHSLHDEISTLANHFIEWDLTDEKRENEWGTSNLFSAIKYRPNRVDFVINAYLLNELQDPSIKAVLNMSVNCVSFSSYAIFLYMYCLRYHNEGRTDWVSISDIAKIVGLTSGHCSSSREICGVIQSAVKEINAMTDIVIKSKIQRSGCKIEHVQFSFCSSAKMNYITSELIDLNQNLFRLFHLFHLFRSAHDKCSSQHRIDVLNDNDSTLGQGKTNRCYSELGSHSVFPRYGIVQATG